MSNVDQKHSEPPPAENADPLVKYVIVSELGGSTLGSVSKVKKQSQTVAGSVPTPTQGWGQHDCFNLNQFVGGLFRYCLGGTVEMASPRADHSEATSTNQGDENVVDHLAKGHSDEVTRRDGFYALKTLHLSRVKDETLIEQLKNEIAGLKTLDHPNIARTLETFEYRRQIFLVMELCDGGGLAARMPYIEEEVARIITSILTGIAYIHSKSICHGNLKYEDILFANKSPQSDIKLIGFGLTTRFGPDDSTQSALNIYTLAPEALDGNFTKSADLWSVGVITYKLMCGQYPFFGRRRSQVVERITQGKFEFKGQRWKHMSEQAKLFVKSLLVLDPEKRPTAEEVIGAEWLDRRVQSSVR